MPTSILRFLAAGSAMAMSVSGLSPLSASAAYNAALAGVHVDPHDAQLLYDGQIDRGEKQNFLANQFGELADRYERRWSKLPLQQISLSRELKRGDEGEDVLLVKKRLGLVGHGIFDQELEATVSRFRDDHGLPAGLTVDDEMVQILNRGPDYYLKTLRANAARASALPTNLGDKFILVDVAAQNLLMFENKKIVGSMRVVVGKASSPTPVMAGMLREAIFNPYWNIPSSLLRETYAGRVLNGGEAYLKRANFEILSDWTDDAKPLSYKDVDWRAVQRGESEIRLRQRPGAGNGMGAVKFEFPNDLGIYLHDTPSKELFEADQRLFSAGCVRLSEPERLTKWLFGNSPQIDPLKAEQIEKLTHPVPVYITYFTSVPTKRGIAFREDVYSRDAAQFAALN